MRKRSNCFTLRLDDAELKHLDTVVERCGLTRQAYLRHLISGYVPRAAPTKIFFDLTSTLARIGNNMNQIAAKANSTGRIDAEEYERNAEELHRLIMNLTDAVINPQPIADASLSRTYSDDRTAELIRDMEAVIEKYKSNAAPDPALRTDVGDTCVSKADATNALLDDLFGDDTNDDEVVY